MKCIQLIPILTLALPLCLAENYEKGLVVTPRKAELQIKRGNEVLATARAGDKLTILRSKGTWVGVEFGNRRGWVKAADVRPLAKPASQPDAAGRNCSSIVCRCQRRLAVLSRAQLQRNHRRRTDTADRA